MNRFQFGFLGCGNMGGALAQAAAKTLRRDRLAVCDADPKKTEPFEATGSATVVDLATLVEESEYLFLAIKPQGLEKIAKILSPMLAKKTAPTVIVSMLAGVEISKLEAVLSFQGAVIRMMPNTPVAVGKGMILYDANELATEKILNGFLTGLSAAGRFDRLSEHLIDAAGSLSGCGPAFVYLFAEALADGAVECGLARDKANLYAAQTLLGAAEMLLQS